MSLTPEQVRHIARLARLGIEDAEVDRFAGQLSEILDYFERLRQVDTDDVPPTAHTLPLHNVFRDDVPAPSWTRSRPGERAPTGRRPVQGAGGAGRMTGPYTSLLAGMTDVHYLTMTDAAEALRKREVSSVELTRAAYERIKSLDGSINAFLTLTEESALEQARAADERSRAARRAR